MLCGRCAFAQAPGTPQETVIVTATAYPVPFEALSRTVTILTREQIAQLPGVSVEQLLKYASSVEVRARGPFGVQSDFSVRGAGYGQTLVLVNGIRINDSQTGHHNGDIPVLLEDIDRVEILYGPGSSLYGADALGGTINIITRKTETRQAAAFSTGSHGFVDGWFVAGFKTGGITQSISASASRSSGFMFDRDFRNLGVTSQTLFGDKTFLFLSHQDKDFGANGFYGPSPSREWVNSTLVSVEHQAAFKHRGTLSARFHYRTHGDHFLWDIERPGFFENRHRTHAFGGRLLARWSFSDESQLTLGGELGRDWIGSNNLGDHSFARVSFFAELQQRLGQSIILSPGLRQDFYSNFGSATSPSISGSWWMRPEIKFRASLAHAFRIPTFTELYYRDPNHRASSTLEPERSWGAEVGLDWLPSPKWVAKFTAFSRWEESAIDWIRDAPGQRWRTANIRDLQTDGFELGLQRLFRNGTLLQAEYTYLSSQTDSYPWQSKYVLDYARHSLSAFGSYSLPFEFGIAPTVSYKRRNDGRFYWILDGRLTRSFGRLSLYLEASNLLDTRYQEVRGVEMPGRWIRIGMRWNNN